MSGTAVAYIALCLVIFAGLVLLGRQEQRFAYFWRLRHSIAFGALLLALPLAAWIPATRSVSRALFVLENRMQVSVLTWICLMASTMVITTYWVTRTNTDARLGTHLLGSVASRESGWNGVRWMIFLLMGLSIPLATIGYTHFDWQAAETGGSAVFQLGPGVLIGVAFSLATLFLLAGLQRILLDQDVTESGLLPFEKFVEPLPFCQQLDVAKWAVRYLPAEFPGYVRQLNGEKKLVAGHAQLALVLFFLLACYFSQFAWTVWQNQSAEALPYIPALAYGVAILLIILAVISGAGFFLDFYRLSAMVTVIALGLLIYGALSTDHYFDPWSQNASVPDPLPLVAEDAQSQVTTVFDQWNFPLGKNGKRTLVVVNASGGGIQASAWTGQVLTGLDERFHGFGESIGLISAVSGGSVGTMYYLAGRKPRTNNYPDSAAVPCIDSELADLIRGHSRASCLAATAWGLAFPDLTRLFVPPLVPRTIDRGWALESAWKHRLSREREDQDPWSLRIMDWAEPIKHGNMPVVVFNATRVETGQRLTISPVYFADRAPAEAVARREPVDFITNYVGSNPLVTTAVRLSATFSYVSPICRPLPSRRHPVPETDPFRYDYHVSDGGYADNEGLVTSLRWIAAVLQNMVKRGQPLPFDQVLVVRIIPFPKTDPRHSPLPNSGLWQTLVGPVSCMNSVRVASQAERGDLELDLVSRQLNEGQDPAVAADNRPVADDPEASLMQQARQLLAQETIPSKAEQLDLADRVEALAEQADEPLEKEKYQRTAAEIRLRNSVPMHYVAFQFSSLTQGANDYQPPLSWKLTPSEINKVDESWDQLWKDAGQPSSWDELGAEIEPQDLSLFFEERD